MDFGEVLSRAWKTIWKHKILWIFGILSSCGQGGGGGGSGGGSSAQSSGGNNWRGEVPPAMQEFFFNIDQFFNQIEVWHIVGIVAILIIVLFLFWLIAMALNTIGKIGLMQGTVQSEEGVEKLKFRALFNSGKPFFWRVLGLNFLIGLVAFVLVLVTFVPLALVTVATLGIGLFCLIPLVCLMVPIGWLIQIIIQQANIALVVEDLNIITALKRGWDIFRENLGNLIIMGLILGIGGAIIGFVFAIPLILIIVFTVISTGMSIISEAGLVFNNSLMVGGIALLVYLPVLIFLGGVLRAYIQSAWTLTYLRLTASPDEPASDQLLEEELAIA